MAFLRNTKQIKVQLAPSLTLPGETNMTEKRKERNLREGHFAPLTEAASLVAFLFSFSVQSTYDLNYRKRLFSRPTNLAPLIDNAESN